MSRIMVAKDGKSSKPMEILHSSHSAFGNKSLYSCFDRSTGNILEIEVSEDGSAQWFYNDMVQSGYVATFK